MDGSTRDDPCEEVRCAGCQQPGPALELERFVYHEVTGLLHDMRGDAPGDPAWTHPLVGCIRPAVWAGFERELDVALDDLDAAELVGDVRRNVRERWRERTVDAIRLGEAIAGVESVDRDLVSGDVEFVLLASDAEFDELPDLRETADRHGVAVFEELDAETLGRAVDGERCRALGFPPSERATAVGRDVEKIICLEEDDVHP